MNKTELWDKLKTTLSSWRLGDYFRQFSIVAGGVIVTFWGSDLITEYGRQKEVKATMQLVIEELQHNRSELTKIKNTLDIDVHMSLLLQEQKMDASVFPVDTLFKYGKFFGNMTSFEYTTDALDVLKGSSLMQHVADKRLLQDVLQTYFKLGKIQKDINSYYAIKKDILMGSALSMQKKKAVDLERGFKDEVLLIMQDDRFANFVLIVPGFIDWEDFDSLNKVLNEQIEKLEAKYN